MIRAAATVFVFATTNVLVSANEEGGYAEPAQQQYGYAAPAQQQYGYAEPAQQQYGYAAPAQQQYGYAAPAQEQYGYAAPAQQQYGYAAPSQEQYGYAEPAKGYGKQSQYDPYEKHYAQPEQYPPSTVYPTPAPTSPYAEAIATPPPDFVAPGEPYPVYHEKPTCTEKCKPNAAKYMAYVCSSLYASALKWGNNNCKGYYAVENAYDKKSLYQARLCTYWTQRSVLRVVTSCFIEAHLRNEFVMKHGKEGPGIWFCRYKEFVDQVLDCYKHSLKYYPLGDNMNSIESTVAALYTPNKDDMPPFQFKGASVAMCAYYNNDQVYNHGAYY